jgi:hypothetical protein
MTKKKPDQKPESEPVSGTGTDVASLVKLITNLTGREPTQQELQEAQDTLSGKRTPSSYVSVAWPPFAQKLAATLEKLAEDQYLILSVKRSNRFVQFAGQGSFGMRVETTSNSYLSKEEQLNERQLAALIEIGWHEPTGTPANSTPERDPDGSPNFFMEFPAPVSCEAVANLAVRTFTEILRLPHPGNLEYEAFDEDTGAMALPELGLRLAVRTPQTDDQEDLATALLATLRETTELPNLEYDDDGDIGLRNGSAKVFVRLIREPLCVRIYSPLLQDVEENPDILVRLNDINANQPLMRFVYRNGIIFGVTDIVAAPFVSAHVAQAFEHFCAIADGMDNLLQAEFGGRTTYPETMPSLLKH